MSWWETFEYYWIDLADKRTYHWPFLGDPLFMPCIIASYLYFVLHCGPLYMKNREPYDLTTFVRWYNAFQVIANTLFVYHGISAGWFKTLSIFRCEPIVYTYEHTHYKLAKVLYWVFVVKLIDLSETVVFVLRKKDKQISFLHLYHHVSTLLIGWLGVRYIAGGMCSMLMIVNSSVHVIMYTYYFLSSFGPRVREIINPFKRYITIIQMVQFIGLIIYLSQGFFESCRVPEKFLGPPFMVNLLINFYLFYDFYRKAYMKPKPKAA